MAEITIYFDMDGTLANFYGVNGWLSDLERSDPRPYIEAKPLFDFTLLTSELLRLKALGYHIGIISWLSKCGTPDFNNVVTQVKREWLTKYLPLIEWDEINIVNYGTPKSTVAREKGYLFDDEERNRNEWGANAFDVDSILDVLRTF